MSELAFSASLRESAESKIAACRESLNSLKWNPRLPGTRAPRVDGDSKLAQTDELKQVKSEQGGGGRVGSALLFLTVGAAILAAARAGIARRMGLFKRDDKEKTSSAHPRVSPRQGAVAGERAQEHRLEVDEASSRSEAIVRPVTPESAKVTETALSASEPAEQPQQAPSIRVVLSPGTPAQGERISYSDAVSASEKTIEADPQSDSDKPSALTVGESSEPDCSGRPSPVTVAGAPASGERRGDGASTFPQKAEQPDMSDPVEAREPPCLDQTRSGEVPVEGETQQSEPGSAPAVPDSQTPPQPPSESEQVTLADSATARAATVQPAGESDVAEASDSPETHRDGGSSSEPGQAGSRASSLAQKILSSIKSANLRRMSVP